LAGTERPYNIPVHISQTSFIPITSHRSHFTSLYNKSIAALLILGTAQNFLVIINFIIALITLIPPAVSFKISCHLFRQRPDQGFIFFLRRIEDLRMQGEGTGAEGSVYIYDPTNKDSRVKAKCLREQMSRFW